MSDTKGSPSGSSPALGASQTIPNMQLGASFTAAGAGASSAQQQNFFSGGDTAYQSGFAAAAAAASAEANSSAAAAAAAAAPKTVRDYLLKRVGFVPRDAFGWLYACRGLYQSREYALVIEGLSHCLRNENTSKEAQHLLAFSLLHTRQLKPAAHAFLRSIQAGNQTDWQPLIELLLEQKQITIQPQSNTGAAASTAAASQSTGTTSKSKKLFS